VKMHANKREPVDEVRAGDIGAVVGLKNTYTGDTLCDEEHPIALNKIQFPDAVISMSPSGDCSSRGFRPATSSTKSSGG